MEISNTTYRCKTRKRVQYLLAIATCESTTYRQADHFYSFISCTAQYDGQGRVFTIFLQKQDFFLEPLAGGNSELLNALPRSFYSLVC